MIRRQLLISLISATTLLVASCDGGGEKKAVLAPESFEGRISFSDRYSIEIENKSAHDFDDVKLALAFFDGEGNRHPLNQRWAHWDRGETKKVIARNANGEAIKVLNGAAAEGSTSKFSFRLTISLGDEH